MTTTSAVAAVKPQPIPKDPRPPQDILEAVAKPLFRGQYSAEERDSWRVGIPLIGTKVSSERDVAFTNEFNVLKASRAMVGYASNSYDDAVRKASRLAFDWSDPSLGGEIYQSVGIGVLQAADGAYYTALIGSGDPRTSGSELGYRNDRFDSNIYGNPKRAADGHPTSRWTRPVDGDGNPVKKARTPDNAVPVKNRHVKDIKLEAIVPYSSTLKAVVDLHNVWAVDKPVEALV